MSQLHSDFIKTETNTFTFSRELAFDETDKTHNAFSGCDITAYMGHKRVASLQGVTVSVVCEVMPIYTFGGRGPKAFVKGKRAISGNLVFTQLNQRAVLEEADAFRDFDQIPPFDIIISMVNNSGTAAMAAILDVQLADEDYGWTLDDLTGGIAITYTAKEFILPFPTAAQDNVPTKILHKKNTARKG